jgi:hypothetical protein
VHYGVETINPQKVLMKIRSSIVKKMDGLVTLIFAINISKLAGGFSPQGSKFSPQQRE